MARECGAGLEGGFREWENPPVIVQLQIMWSRGPWTVVLAGCIGSWSSAIPLEGCCSIQMRGEIPKSLPLVDCGCFLGTCTTSVPAWGIVKGR